MLNETPSESKKETPKDSSLSSSAEKPSSPKLSAIEVLSSDDEGMGEITQAAPNSKKSWLPWKRPNRRDEQLGHLREGYIELLGLVRSIGDHLDRQKDEKSQVNALVESLPPALSSFEKLASSQKEVTSILGNLNSHMEKTSEKDQQLLENLTGFNSTLKDVSSSNQKSLGTLHQVSERIEHSDEQMKMLFQQANQNNQATGALMVRLEKRVFLSNLALVSLLCLLLLLGVFWVAKAPPTWKPEAAAPQSAPFAASPSPAPVVVSPPVSEVAPALDNETPDLAEAPVEATAEAVVETAAEVVAETPIEGVGLLGEASIPAFPTEAENESTESKVPPLLSPQISDSPVEGEEPPAEEEEIEKLDLFVY